MSYNNILVEVEGPLVTVFVDRPDKLNALNNETIAELTQCFERLTSDQTVGCVILTGSGEKAFIAGADIGMLVDQEVFDGCANSAHGQRLTRAMEESTKPVIAAINGYALGGGLEMAMACDLRFASEFARLGLPEVSLGIIPGYGGTQRLPRIVGMGNALQLMMTGDPIKAEEAYRIGLVNGVFPPEDLMDKTKEVARKIIARGPQAVGLAKQAARRGADMPLDQGMALEADLFGMISSTDEMKEGMRAFLEKRDPTWKRS